MITNRITINPHNFYYLNSTRYRYPSRYRYQKTKASCSLIKAIQCSRMGIEQTAGRLQRRLQHLDNVCFAHGRTSGKVTVFIVDDA